jgi:hypothetical protein
MGEVEEILKDVMTKHILIWQQNINGFKKMSCIQIGYTLLPQPNH